MKGCSKKRKRTIEGALSEAKLIYPVFLSFSGLRRLRSVVEEADARKYHHHTVLVAGIYYRIVSYGSAGLYDIFYAAFSCSFDIVGEGEECIGSKRYTGII